MMLWAGSTILVSLPPVTRTAAWSDGAYAAPLAAAGTGAASCRRAICAEPPPALVPLAIGPAHAATRRPVPVTAAPAMRNARAACGRARAPMARSDGLMHLGRSGAAIGFVCPQQNRPWPMRRRRRALPGWPGDLPEDRIARAPGGDRQACGPAADRPPQRRRAARRFCAGPG